MMRHEHDKVWAKVAEIERRHKEIDYLGHFSYGDFIPAHSDRAHLLAILRDIQSVIDEHKANYYPDAKMPQGELDLITYLEEAIELAKEK